MQKNNQDVFYNEDGIKISICFDDKIGQTKTIVEKNGMKSVLTQNSGEIKMEIMETE